MPEPASREGEEEEEEADGERDGWREREGGMKGVCGFYLARRPDPLAGFNYLYDQSLRGSDTTQC